MPVLEQDGGKVKPSGYKQEYTLEQAKEILRCSEDPIYFIKNYVKILRPKLGAVPFELYEFQERLIRTYHENTRTISMLSRQCGKALALDTPIPTPTGWTTMGDIKVGDTIIGDDGNPTLVSFVTEVMTNHDCYDITFDNGEVITADAEHIWRISSNVFESGRESDVTTEQLIPILRKARQRGQSVRIAISHPLDTQSVDLPIKPYTLGLWLGDGNSCDGRFTTHVDDSTELVSLIESDGYVVSEAHPDKHRITTVGHQIYDILPKLKDMDVWKNKHIPSIYLRSSVEQRLELLRGLMDSDGHARPRGACEFYQKDKRFAEQVFELVASLGIKPRLREKNVGQKIYYTVVFSTKRFRVFNLTRKAKLQELCHGHDKNYHHYIRKIEPVESVSVRCIQVDNASHMFLCGRSMIPTHNTTTAAGYILWWAIFKNNQKIFIASKDQGGANEIMERLWFAYEELPWWIKPGVKEANVKTKVFDNGTKIETSAATKTSGRGKSPDLVYLDEFAFVRPNEQKEFWVSIFAALSTGGDLIMTSTPNTDEDKFAELWFGARPGDLSDKWEDRMAKRYAVKEEDIEPYETIYETEEAEAIMAAKNMMLLDDEGEDEDLSFVSFHAHWTSVPDKVVTSGPEKGKVISYRGERFKNNQLRSGLSNEEWLREYECCFIGGDSTLISGPKLASFRNTVRDPRFVDRWGCRWYEQILPNTAYAVIMDPSGDGIGDDAAIQVWEIPTLRQVAEWNDAEADQDEQARMLRRVLERIHLIQEANPDHDGVMDIYYSVERNSVGIGIIRAIEHMGEENFPGWLIDASEVSLSVRGESTMPGSISKYRGLVTTNATKKRYAQDLKQFIERNLFVVRSKFLASQLKVFVKSGPGWGARAGSKDDLVMSGVLMCHLIDELRSQEPDLDDYVRPILDDYDPDDLNHPDNQAMLPVV